MSERLVAAGTQLSIADLDGKGGLSIFVNQPKGSTAKWRFSVRCVTDEGEFFVGEFTITPPASNTDLVLTRAVGVANMPGAKEWSIFVDLADGAQDGATASLAVGCCCGNEPGVSRVGERYKYYTGTAATVTLGPDEQVIGWSAFAIAAGATVTIAAGSTSGGGAIPVPVGGAVSGNPAGSLTGIHTLAFAGTSGYLVEVLESA